jgi:alkylhydroperoxidase family enzyme
LTARFTEVGPGRSDPSVERVYARFEQEGREPIALYRTLAGVPWLLAAYNDFAVALRREPVVSRALRELVILRAAQLTQSDYEWAHHRPMAATAGVRDDQIARLQDWRSSDLFDARQRAALTCVERIHALDLDAEAFALVRSAFSSEEAIELIVVCAFYEMVPRLIQAFGLGVEAAYAGFAEDAPSTIRHEDTGD